MKELDFVLKHIEKVISGEMTSEELKTLKKEKIASGEVVPMPKSKGSFEFSQNNSNYDYPSNWEQLEYQYHQSKLINSDA